MKEKILSFLVLPSIVFALFLVFSPLSVDAGTIGCEISVCKPISCGTTEGTKEVPVYGEVCDKGCPTVKFETEQWTCPNNYYYWGKDPSGTRWCERNGGQINFIRATLETFGPIDVQYGLRSNDPNKCHRPNVNDLNIPNWANNDYNNNVAEHLDFIDVNCHQEQTGTEIVACNDARVIPCEESCPTECGYPGGTVADGQGGQKTCDPTNSCSTHRWCFPNEDSPTGYLAEAISIDITPEIGIAWDSETMIDRYCYERCSVTTPSYDEWGDWIVDNENESLLVGKRTVTYYDSVETEYVCSTSVEKQIMDRPLCQYEGITYADDPLCLPLDDEDVLSATDDTTKDTGVVLAATGPTDNIAVYIVELFLVALLVTSSVFFTKTYLKNSK